MMMRVNLYGCGEVETGFDRLYFVVIPIKNLVYCKKNLSLFVGLFRAALEN